MTLIDCKNVTVQYGSFVACENVSFSVDSGEYLCVVGANGSGKSTIVKTVTGLLKAKSGIVNRKELQCGYLPQKTNIQRDFPASVREVVRSGVLCNGKFFLSKKDRENVELQMKRLDLEKIADKSFAELSGGQQQRVLLARALCAAKNMIILDEPVTGLDPVVTDELYSIIRKLNKSEGIAVLMVSHDVHRAVQNATHILHMNNRVEFFGTVEEYKKTQLYGQMSNVEVCETHLCNHCGTDCNASHIPGLHLSVDERK